MPTKLKKKSSSKRMTTFYSTPKSSTSPNMLLNPTKPYLLDSLTSFKSHKLFTLLPSSFTSLATSNFTESSTPPNFIPANHLSELSHIHQLYLQTYYYTNPSYYWPKDSHQYLLIPSVMGRPQGSTLGLW
jgi:hypothetical protein